MRKWQLVVARCLTVPNSADASGLPEPDADTATYVVMMKGAPETILSLCEHVAINDQVEEITDEYRQDCQVMMLRTKCSRRKSLYLYWQILLAPIASRSQQVFFVF